MADIEEIQEKVTEGSDEEEDLGSNEPSIDLSFLGEGEQEKRTPVADVIAQKAAGAGRKVGGAARGVLSGVGERITEPPPPGDDLSDLFEAPNMDTDNDVYVKDLVALDEEDTFGEGGADMSDILEVSEEDIMGTEDYIGDESLSSTPKRPVHRAARPAVSSRLSGLQ